MTWTPETPLTVGDIRKAMEGLPDDAQVFVDGNPDRPIVGVITSEQIPHDRTGWNPDEEPLWQKGDPLITGLELWLGGDDEFPAPRCNHSPAVPTPGQESVEWAVRCEAGFGEHTGGPRTRAQAEKSAERLRQMWERGGSPAEAIETIRLVRRTRTKYRDRVTEWAEVAPGGETDG